MEDSKLKELTEYEKVKMKWKYEIAKDIAQHYIDRLTAINSKRAKKMLYEVLLSDGTISKEIRDKYPEETCKNVKWILRNSLGKGVNSDIKEGLIRRMLIEILKKDEIVGEVKKVIEVSKSQIDRILREWSESHEVDPIDDEDKKYMFMGISAGENDEGEPSVGFENNLDFLSAQEKIYEKMVIERVKSSLKKIYKNKEAMELLLKCFNTYKDLIEKCKFLESGEYKVEIKKMMDSLYEKGNNGILVRKIMEELGDLPSAKISVDFISDKSVKKHLIKLIEKLLHANMRD